MRKSQARFPRPLRPHDFPTRLLRHPGEPLRWIHHRHRITQLKHRQIRATVGVAVAIPQLAIFETRRRQHLHQPLHLRRALVVFQIREKLPQLHRRPQRQVKPKLPPDFRHVKLRTCRRQDQKIPRRPLRFQLRPQLRINRRHQRSRELPRIFRQHLRIHPPQIAQENPLHPARAQQTRERQERQEHRQENPPPRLPPQHEMPEQQLAVPGDQGPVQVKQSDARRRSFRNRCWHAPTIQPSGRGIKKSVPAVSAVPAASQIRFITIKTAETFQWQHDGSSFASAFGSAP